MCKRFCVPYVARCTRPAIRKNIQPSPNRHKRPALLHNQVIVYKVTLPNLAFCQVPVRFPFINILYIQPFSPFFHFPSSPYFGDNPVSTLQCINQHPKRAAKQFLLVRSFALLVAHTKHAISVSTNQRAAAYKISQSAADINQNNLVWRTQQRGLSSINRHK
jgi:hypothetical protein